MLFYFVFYVDAMSADSLLLTWCKFGKCIIYIADFDVEMSGRQIGEEDVISFISLVMQTVCGYNYWSAKICTNISTDLWVLTTVFVLDRLLDYQSRRFAIHPFKEKAFDHKAVMRLDGIISRANQRGLLDYWLALTLNSLLQLVSWDAVVAGYAPGKEEWRNNSGFGWLEQVGACMLCIGIRLLLHAETA